MTDTNARPKTSRGTLVLIWIIVALAAAAAIYFLFVKPAMDSQAAEHEMYCDMLYTFGTPGYWSCLSG